MKLNCKRIDFTYTPGEEIFNFPRNRDYTLSSM